jgi:hypothetical protein
MPTHTREVIRLRTPLVPYCACALQSLSCQCPYDVAGYVNLSLHIHRHTGNGQKPCKTGRDIACMPETHFSRSIPDKGTGTSSQDPDLRSRRHWSLTCSTDTQHPNSSGSRLHLAHWLLICTPCTGFGTRVTGRASNLLTWQHPRHGSGEYT